MTPPTAPPTGDPFGFVGLTYDDVLLLPGETDVIPSAVVTTTRLTREVSIAIPILSAAMDTVTEARMAVALARHGGIGILHRNLSIEDQAGQVDLVKRSESGMISDPVTIGPDVTVAELDALCGKFRVSGLPVVDADRMLLGIVTNRDLRFVSDAGLRVADVMTSKNLVTAKPGISMEHSKALLHEHRIEKLLVVDDDGALKGLITIKDLEKIKKYPNAAKDGYGRLLVGAALGVGAGIEEQAERLIKAGVDVVAIDSAHGHSEGVLRAVRQVRGAFPDLQIIAGNVATERATEDLIKAGVNAVKVGVGPGSICTTRIVAGVGVPQMTAIQGCVKAGRRHGIPIIADGGIKHSGDLTKAIGAGADSVMIGSLLAGTDETPGETFLYQGRTYKGYRGMGSLGAMNQGSGDRYFQGDITSSAKFVPEGIEGKVPYRGSLAGVIYQLLGGLRSGMGYVGAANIAELQENARFVRISAAGLKESHVHDVIITKEAPNYHTP